MKDRSRSFVAEMLHLEEEPSSMTKWSHQDRALLQKLGISPSDGGVGDGERPKLRISSNLHPDLKQHAFEEEISSLSAELQQSRKNLMRAAEYGQHLVEQNSDLEAVVLELRNDAAEYIASLCELREENERMKLEAQSNEYSVTDFEHKMRRHRTDNEDLSERVLDLEGQIADSRLKYEMEQSRCKVLEAETEKNEAKISELEATYHRDVDALRTKLMVLQNTNHSLSMQHDKMKRDRDEMAQQKNVTVSVYTDSLSLSLCGKLQKGCSLHFD